MKFKTRLATAVIGAITMTGISAQAQMWGSGYNMGQQPCVYAVKAGDGTDSSDDEVKDMKAELKADKAKLKELNTRERRYQTNLDKDQETLTDYFQDKYAQVIINHYQNNKSCNDSTYLPTGPATSQPGQDQQPSPDDTTNNKGPHTDNPPASGPVGDCASSNAPKYCPFSQSDWANFCSVNQKSGTLDMSVCNSGTRFLNSDTNHKNANDCRRALNDFTRDQSDDNKIQKQISDLEDKIDRIENRDLPDAQDRAKDDKADKDDSGGTEGAICINCMAKGNSTLPSTSNLVAAGIDASAAALLYFGERNSQRMVAQYNSSIGYPTYNTTNYMPTAMLGAAAVGSLFSGSGQGTYGCSNQGMMASGTQGYGANAFGYPQNMFGTPMGGGMFNPMTGTWGAAGPWGLSGNPYMSGGMSPYGGAAMMGNGLMSPYGMGGAMGGYPGGMPGMMPSMPGAGFGVNPGFGLMGGAGGYLGSNGYGSAGPYGFGYGGSNMAAENSVAMGTTYAGLQQEMINLQSRTNQMLGTLNSGGAYGAGGAYGSVYGANPYMSSYGYSPYNSGSGISGYLGLNFGSGGYGGYGYGGYGGGYGGLPSYPVNTGVTSGGGVTIPATSR